jgi:hypothetical protein
MKNAIAVVVSALGGAACGAAIALLCCGPVREEAAGEEGGAGKALGSRPASLPEVNAGSANGAPEEIEVSRTPIVADAERALTELKAELDRARTELGRAQEQLDGVRAELAFARENPAEDFFRRFKALEMTQGLTEAEKTSLFVHVVKPLWELPKAEQIRPLADAIGRYKAALEKWRFDWLEDPSGPRGDRSHPDAQRYLEEYEQLRMRWLEELGAALGDREKALALFE